MANPSKIKIPRVPDKAIFNAFAEVARNYPETNITINAFGCTNLGAVSPGSKSYGESVDLLLKENGTAIESLSVHIKGFSVNYYRGGLDHNNANNKSGIYDELHFSFNTNAPEKLTDHQRIEVIAFLTKKLNAFNPDRNFLGLSEEDVAAQAIHVSIMERLEELNIELIQKTNDFRQQLEGDFHAKVLALEQDSEKEREALNEKFQEKSDEVEKTKQHLEKRLKEVDDRDNTHVRRELRKDLQTEINNRQDSFKLTKDTNKLRWPIHSLCLLTILCLFFLSIFYGESVVDLINTSKMLASVDPNTVPKPNRVEVPDAVLIIMTLKTLGLTASAIGFAIFYLKWMNRWLDQHTQAEFQLKQFQLDVDRASWAVETALAWKSEVKDVIPSTLLESITRNLFRNDHKPTEAALHPADQLASALLGTASKVRLKAGDSEIELDGKKLGKAEIPNKKDE